MRIIDRLVAPAVNKAVASIKASRTWPLVFPTGNQQFVSPHFHDYETFLLAIQKIDWVYSCVSLHAYTIAKNEWNLYKPGTDEIIDKAKHPFGQRLIEPNDYQEWFEFCEQMVIYLRLTGNNFTGLEYGNRTPLRGAPDELHNLRPSMVYVVPDPVNRIKGYLYLANGKKVPYLPEEIQQIKYSNPNDELYGLGVIEAGQNTFNAELSMQLSQVAFFANGMQPSGFVSTDREVGDREWERAKHDFQETHGGVKNKFKTAFFDSGLKYFPISIDPGTVGVSQLSKDSRDRIVAMMGTPLSKLGIRETSAVKDDQEDRFYYNETILPDLVRISGALNKLARRMGFTDIEHRFELQKFDDSKSRAETAEIQARTGAATINDLRRTMGFTPIAEGDVLPVSLGSDLQQVTVLEPKRLAITADGTKGDLCEIIDIEASNIKALMPSLKASLKKSRRRALLKARKEIELKAAKSFAPKIAKFFDDQGARVIAKMTAAGKPSSVDIDKLFDKAEDEAAQKMIRGLHMFILDQTVATAQEIFGKQAKAEAAGLFPDGWEFPNRDKFLADVGKQIKTINGTSKTKIERVISEGLRRGYSMRQIQTGVEKIDPDSGRVVEKFVGVQQEFNSYAEATSYRTERIVRTETMQVYNKASLETYGSLGLEKVELADNLSGDDDPDCVERDGKVMTLEEAEAEMDDEHPNGTLTLMPYLG